MKHVDPNRLDRVILSVLESIMIPVEIERFADKWGCRGFAGDPTVHHSSKLHEQVTFHNIGATMLQDNEGRLINE